MERGPLELKRQAGILLPVFSLPGRYGIGSFGKGAYDFVDFLKSAGVGFWQILPMGPTSYGDSPYQSFSTFAGNPYFIDPDRLVEEGLLTADETADFAVPAETADIDYSAVYRTRYILLRKAYDRFMKNDGKSGFSGLRVEFSEFVEKNAFWLEDFALFMTCKAINGGKSFLEWELPLRMRDAEAMDQIISEHEDEAGFQKFLQFLFSVQFTALKKYANEAGIGLIGDIPIYVAPDSSDVWANPELYQLGADCRPVAVAGCPPDAFSATGQLWGNPLYKWGEHKKSGYEWWLKRLSHAFSQCDVLRIDHFRGFESYYSIPAKNKTAEFGHWEKGPGLDFFETVRNKLGDVPVIAEDLGFLTTEVVELVEKTGYPGMKVLQFAFDSREDSDYLPHNYTKRCVVYTGTHDNDTTRSWFSTIPENDRRFAMDYLGLDDEEDISRELIRAAYASVSCLAVIPMQDWLDLGGEARINHPSTLGGNWCWRLDGSMLTDELAEEIKHMTALYARGGR
ncbi:MAG: 4-alpha-glucanotransferase [Lachnospiraceae bacterium]|nr:4-alpha-glucanotransferase [Lachnospiraceae bacterium]